MRAKEKAIYKNGIRESTNDGTTSAHIYCEMHIRTHAHHNIYRHRNNGKRHIHILSNHWMRIRCIYLCIFKGVRVPSILVKKMSTPWHPFGCV